jgi:DNA mismatch endonuclease, patch repair protein
VETKYGFLTTETRSRLMSKIKGTNTSPEISLRKALWKLGHRYRKNYKKLPGKPDIVFIKKRVVVFIDGEFWHGYEWEKKKTKIKANRLYWITKIEKNISRDKINRKQLEKQNWKVIEFWMHEIKDNPTKCINRVIKAIT